MTRLARLTCRCKRISSIAFKRGRLEVLDFTDCAKLQLPNDAPWPGELAPDDPPLRELRLGGCDLSALVSSRRPQAGISSAGSRWHLSHRGRRAKIEGEQWQQ